MNILYLLVPAAILLATAGVTAFVWAVRAGQYEDTDTPAIRMLLDDDSPVQSTIEQSSDNEPVFRSPPHSAG